MSIDKVVQDLQKATENAFDALVWMKAILQRMKGRYTPEDVDELETCACEVIALLEHTPQWVRTSERLPELPGVLGVKFVIAYTRGRVIPLMYAQRRIRSRDVERWEYLDGQIYHGDVIAWQPLPEAPKGLA